MVDARSATLGVQIKVSSQGVNLGKSKRGLTNGGLSPTFSEKILGGIDPEKSGLCGTDWGLSRVYSGLFGADRDQFLGTLFSPVARC